MVIQLPSGYALQCDICGAHSPSHLAAELAVARNCGLYADGPWEQRRGDWHRCPECSRQARRKWELDQKALENRP